MPTREIQPDILGRELGEVALFHGTRPALPLQIRPECLKLSIRMPMYSLPEAYWVQCARF